MRYKNFKWFKVIEEVEYIYVLKDMKDGCGYDFEYD